MTDPTLEGPPFNKMKDYYIKNFSLGHLNTSSVNEKFALIALLCWITFKAREKRPDVTFYQIIYKIDNSLPEVFIKGLAIICEDFSYGYKDVKAFPTFNIEPKDMVKTIQGILKTYLPF